ncbi:MAG: sugar phosphate isomerase/epimerase, partial [Planctomycetota bacterium]|nr:sugar phosphate isomerase/epimerase [Planctomycetota bacterium]
MSLPPLGAQLIVLGKKYNINKDTDAVLDCLAKAGYAGVEGGATDAKMYRVKLDARGLRYASSHVTPKALLDLKPLIEYLRIVGGSDLCNSGLLDWNKRSLADFKETIGILNRAGRELRKEGIRLHYHNHDFEFAKVDGGRSDMDIFIDGLEPDACDLCVDVAWVQKGGSDPAAFLRQHNSRIGYLHLKDFNDEGWIELGQGKVKFAEIMRVLPEMKGGRWAVIEQDSSRLDPLDSI